MIIFACHNMCLCCVYIACVLRTDISPIKHSKLSIQPSLLELDKNQALESNKNIFSVLPIFVDFSHYLYDNCSFSYQ